MEAVLLTHTPNPQHVLQNAYSQCYQRDASITTVLKHIHHQSVLEHVSYTFNLKLSRVAWEQMVRHRIASYTAQSHRYTEPTEEDCYCFIPPSVVENGRVEDYITMCKVSYANYKWLRDCGVTKQDARYVLPKGVAIRVQVTMNLRALINFLSLRMGRTAQQEIKSVAELMWNEVKPTIPDLAETIERELIKRDG